MDNIILRCDPMEGGEQFKLLTAYVTLADGVTITDAINEDMVIGYHDLEAQLTQGAGTIPYRFYLLKAPMKIGPIFCEEALFFTPFLVVHNDDTAFHCENCARLFVEWFVEMQTYWAEEYHGDWWNAASQRQATRSQRLS